MFQGFLLCVADPSDQALNALYALICELPAYNVGSTAMLIHWAFMPMSSISARFSFESVSVRLILIVLQGQRNQQQGMLHLVGASL